MYENLDHYFLVPLPVTSLFFIILVSFHLSKESKMQWKKTPHCPYIPSSEQCHVPDQTCPLNNRKIQ